MNDAPTSWFHAAIILVFALLLVGCVLILGVRVVGMLPGG